MHRFLNARSIFRVANMCTIANTRSQAKGIDAQVQPPAPRFGTSLFQPSLFLKHYATSTLHRATARKQQQRQLTNHGSPQELFFWGSFFTRGKVLNCSHGAKSQTVFNKEQIYMQLVKITFKNVIFFITFTLLAVLFLFPAF